MNTNELIEDMIRENLIATFRDCLAFPCQVNYIRMHHIRKAYRGRFGTPISRECGG